jgi:hypothetical protein
LFPTHCFEIYLEGITTKNKHTKEIIQSIVLTHFAKHDSRKGSNKEKKSRGTKIMEEERRRIKEIK